MPLVIKIKARSYQPPVGQVVCCFNFFPVNITLCPYIQHSAIGPEWFAFAIVIVSVTVLKKLVQNMCTVLDLCADRNLRKILFICALDFINFCI
jgi:hypothetical protein